MLLTEAFNEVRCLQKVGIHEHVVQLLGTFTEDRCKPRLVLELCGGCVFDRGAQIRESSDRMRRIFREMLLALAHVHEAELRNVGSFFTALSSQEANLVGVKLTAGACAESGSRRVNGSPRWQNFVERLLAPSVNSMQSRSVISAQPVSAADPLYGGGLPPKSNGRYASKASRVKWQASAGTSEAINNDKTELHPPPSWLEGPWLSKNPEAPPRLPTAEEVAYCRALFGLDSEDDAESEADDDESTPSLLEKCNCPSGFCCWSCDPLRSRGRAGPPGPSPFVPGRPDLYTVAYCKMLGIDTEVPMQLDAVEAHVRQEFGLSDPSEPASDDESEDGVESELTSWLRNDGTYREVAIIEFSIAHPSDFENAESAEDRGDYDHDTEEIYNRDWTERLATAAIALRGRRKRGRRKREAGRSAFSAS